MYIYFLYHVSNLNSWSSRRINNNLFLYTISGSLPGTFLNLKKAFLASGTFEFLKDSLPELQKKLSALGIKVYATNPFNTLDEFIGVVNLCHSIISTDSLGLHIALALKKKTIALFFSTIENEVIGDNLIKIQSPLNKDFFYVNGYDPVLANSISVDQVRDAMQRLEL